MRDPHGIVSDWLAKGGDVLVPPPLVQAALRKIEREQPRENFLAFSMAELEHVVEASRQLELRLPDMNARAKVRDEVADYFDHVAKPYALTPAEHRIGDRLREARPGFIQRVRRTDGRSVTIWDDKAGLPLLDPDDAREEAMRVAKRVVPAALKLLEAPGARVYYGVFTVPNAPQGGLGKAMRQLSARFARMLKKCKRDRSLPIIGAYSVMESPLGRHRDWHPHLNVLLITSGWLDFGKLRKLWHWDVHLRRLEGSQARLEAAMREIIKYSARAVPEKSDAKAKKNRRRSDRGVQDRAHARGQEDLPGFDHGRAANARGSAETHGCVQGSTLAGAEASCLLGDDNSPGDELEGWANTAPPPLTGYSPLEFWEWIRAHRGFRRSRGYGCLYRLDDPEPLDLDTDFETTAVGTRGRDGYSVRSPLLRSIPGDKSSGESFRERLKRELRRLLGPPDLPDRARATLDQGAEAWQSIRNALQ